MNRREKENNSRQSNYRCGKNGGIYLTLGIGKRSGQNPFSLCSEMLRILRTGLSGFVLCLLNRNLRHYLGDAEFRVRRSDSQASAQLPCYVTLTRFFQCFEPLHLILEKVGDGSYHTVSQGVSWKTNELMDLQEHDAIWGNYKNLNVHNSSNCLVFIRLVLGWPGECVWKTNTETRTDTHMKQFPVWLYPSSMLDQNLKKKKKDHCTLISVAELKKKRGNPSKI